MADRHLFNWWGGSFTDPGTGRYSIKMKGANYRYRFNRHGSVLQGGHQRALSQGCTRAGTVDFKPLLRHLIAPRLASSLTSIQQPIMLMILLFYG